MNTATIRVPEEKKNILKAISSMENRKLNEVVVELIDEYIERHKETLELLAMPGFYEQLMTSSQEFRKGRGITIENVRKEMES